MLGIALKKYNGINFISFGRISYQCKTCTMNGFSDLAFFTLLAQQPSLAAAAQQMGITPPAVSKRLAVLERRLGVRLLNRTTRRTSLTPEGETYLTEGAKVLQDLDALERTVAGSAATPKGIVRVSATLGFGRQHIAPALSQFARRFPEIEVQMHLSDRPVNLVEQGFDVLVRFGDMPDARLTARSLALNRRLLCATPTYLAHAGRPTTPRDLAQHPCIFIRESDETFGTWHLKNGTRQETVKVRGPLSTNDGEAALTWALDGHGILMRSQWDVAALVRTGQLVAVLPDWQLPPADVFLVFQTKHNLSAKTRALVDFLLAAFEPYRTKGDAALGPW
jgi:DNA-binding transcriptional LysR family regulator